MELAVFLRGEVWATRGVAVSLFVAFRDSHENGLVSLRVLAGGAGAAPVEVAEGDGIGLLPGESWAGGDQGIEGSAFVRLLKDRVLDSFVT
jgi:hypothetical protein